MMRDALTHCLLSCLLRLEPCLSRSLCRRILPGPLHRARLRTPTRIARQAHLALRSPDPASRSAFISSIAVGQPVGFAFHTGEELTACKSQSIRSRLLEAAGLSLISN